MERRKTEELGAVILRFMRMSGLESPLNQYRLINSWTEVAGELVAGHTTEIYIRNQILYVRITPPSLRANLMMNRKNLAVLLNHKVGANVITDITFL